MYVRGENHVSTLAKLTKYNYSGAKFMTCEDSTDSLRNDVSILDNNLNIIYGKLDASLLVSSWPNEFITVCVWV